MLRTAIEHSGAERGLLILSRGADLRVQAEAKIDGSSVTIGLCDAPISSTELPEPVVQYAGRTRESVILEDASARGSFSNDEYIRRQHARSILCLPLVKHGRLVAVLYLENNLAANVFTPARIAVLNVLASEAAISIENSRLYAELQEREAKVQGLNKRLIRSQEEERARIARELHDDLSQQLAALSIKLGTLQRPGHPRARVQRRNRRAAPANLRSSRKRSAAFA